MVERIVFLCIVFAVSVFFIGVATHVGMDVLHHYNNLCTVRR